MQTLLYLHGFNSSSRSAKAQLLSAYIAQHEPNINLLSPQLANTPTAAWQQIASLIQQTPKLCGCVGSSLGGFYATLVSQHYGVPSVLVNPAVRPHQLLQQYLGPQFNPYTHAHYELTAQHIDELRLLTPTRVTPHLYKLLVTEGDEVLDHQQALEFYSGCEQTVESGGDHLFTMFANYLPEIFDFFHRSMGDVENACD
jgi:predicted esterase YcpF (UPF0227 family)